MTNPFVSLEKAAAQMHRGVGPESLIQAAGAWGVVAQKLETVAEELLVVGTQYDRQYWQGPAAQQARDALTSVIQGLKNNVVVAGQVETAATGVVAAFNKAQAATETPQHVADNRWEKAQVVAGDELGLYQSVIAELDEIYEVMWLHSLTAHAIYYHDTSQALERAEQTWWSPHQRPTGASTTAGDHPPTHDAPDIPSQIEQRRDTAAWARIYALDHAIRTTKYQEVYEQQSTYARMCKGLADRGKATVELCNDMAQRHREAAQLHKNLFLGLADIPALAQKYVDIATTWHQTKQQMQETLDAYHTASETRPRLQEMGNSLSKVKGRFANDVGILFDVQNLDFENPDLDSYTNSLQRLSEQIRSTHSEQSIVQMNGRKADAYARVAARIQDCALHQAEEAGNAWRAARQHAQLRTDHAHDFFVFFQMAARVDDQATTLAGSPV